ncbi:MAG: hypothetical protein JO340_10265 [Acidobacteriaceae bacterium]|nr:hypothetical protein [Acidobacteriaceae bacterium]
MMRGRPFEAVELSALRRIELPRLLDALGSLDLSPFHYVSIHAPSRCESNEEALIWDQLQEKIRPEWPIILHPDAIYDFGLWRELGSRVCIENLDKRKPIGRSARSLRRIFEQLPDASLCFDIGHARQVDSTMTEAYLILREFGSRLKQVHVSEVNARSKHDPLSFTSVLGFREVANLIPDSIPLILETPVLESGMDREIEKVREALPSQRNAMVA